MKSRAKTALTLSLLLPLAGCLDFGWSKKQQAHEKGEVATHAPSSEKASQCSHKGCTHDHSKDAHQKPAHDEVKTQGLEDEDGDDDFSGDDDDFSDVVTQNFDEVEDEEYEDEDLN